MRNIHVHASAFPDHRFELPFEDLDNYEPACTDGDKRKKKLAAWTAKCKACIIGLAAMAAFAAVDVDSAQAHYRRYRQYYGGWTYNPIQTYYYRPYVLFAVRFGDDVQLPLRGLVPGPATVLLLLQPRGRHYYWGRYDLKAKGYSVLAEKDRGAKLDDIPEKAFPKPGKMPNIPESKTAWRWKRRQTTFRAARPRRIKPGRCRQ